MILRYQGDDLQEFVVYVLADQKVLRLFTTYTHALYSSIRTLTTATTPSTTTYTHVLYSSIRTLTTTNIKSNVVLKVSDFRIDLFRTICHPFCRSF